MEANASSEKTERMHTIKKELIAEVPTRRETGFRHDHVRRGAPDPTARRGSSDPAETPDRRSPLFRFRSSDEAPHLVTKA